MERKRILITVKTYPGLSSRYDELVCTAGVLEDGSWIRLYPIPFRRIDYEKQYKKYSRIEVDVQPNSSDPRPESFIPDVNTIQDVGRIDTKDNWKKRKAYVLKEVHENMEELITLNRSNVHSLAVFKPGRMLDFDAKPVSEEARRQHMEKMTKILDKRKQGKLLDDGLKNIIPVSIPDYRFYYKFADQAGQESQMLITDWEIQALYRKCLKKKSEEQALEDVRKKYWDYFVKTRDLYLFLGTTRSWERRAKNPFTIIGTFTPGKENRQ